MPQLFAILVISAAGLPLLAAAALLIPGLRRIAVSLLVPLSAVPALCLALLTLAGADVVDEAVSFPWMLTGIRIGTDGVGRIFLLFTSLVWAFAAWYARPYMVKDPGRYRFFFFFLCTMSGNFGLILAQDMVGFYLFFALMTFAAFGLVSHAGSPEAFHAGRIYIIMAVIGEALVIAGMLLAASAAGGNTAFRNLPAAVAASEHRDLIIALVLSGFGVKAGAVPLHLWLPLAHPVAPTPASAVLSGAMIKAGLLGWLRFLPLGVVSLPDWGALCMIAGLSAAFYGVVVGSTQDDPKTVLAYSSVSQMGLLSFGIGIGLTDAEAWPLALPAVLLYAFHHALSKTALFLGVGVAPSAEAGGARRLLVNAGLLLPALALAGAPFLSGAAAKISLKNALGQAGLEWSGYAGGLLSLAAAGTTLLMARFLFLLQRRKRTEAGHGAGAGLLVPWMTLLFFIAASAWTMPEELRGAAGASLSPGNLAGALWPVLAGTLLAWAAWSPRGKRIIAAGLRVPPGDVLAPLTRLLDLAETLGRRTALLVRDAAAARFPVPSVADALSAAVVRTEGRLTRFLAAGLLFLLIATALCIALRQ